VSVPTYNTLKRMTPAIVLIANHAFKLKPDPSRSVVLTIAVVVFGCLVAGYGGGCTSLNQLTHSCKSLNQLTHSLKPPGFNP
jgi:hypothetical protein